MTEANIFDRVYDIVSQTPLPLPVKNLAEAFQMEEYQFNQILDVFANAKVFEIRDNHIVRITPPFGLVRYETMEEGEVLDERPYEWKSLMLKAKVMRIPEELVPIYYIPPLKISSGLRTRLKNLFFNLLRKRGGKVDLDVEYLAPNELSKHLAYNAIVKELGAKDDIADKLSDAMIYEFSDVGCLNIFLQDSDIEEIVFNGDTNALSLYSCRHGWMKTNVYPNGEGSLIEVAQRMARLVNKEINFSNPIVETRLVSGDRVNTLLDTVSPQGTIITIRKFSQRPWSIIGLIKEMETTNIDIAAILWFAVEFDLNILIAGGSGSGKTTLLNAICNLIPPQVHVLSIESVREIHIPESRAWNWLSLVSKDEPNMDKISTEDLIGISLKMRPERIILGEAVKPGDIRSLFQAMQVGHPVYSTIHATTSKELVRRIYDPSYKIPKTDVSSLDMILVMYHDIKKKTRVLQDVSEVSPHGIESGIDIISKMYQYNPKTKEYSVLNKPVKIFKKVAKKTGLSESEMVADIAEKKLVLQWAYEYDISDIKELESVVHDYYADKDTLLESIRLQLEADGPQGPNLPQSEDRIQESIDRADEWDESIGHFDRP